MPKFFEDMMIYQRVIEARLFMSADPVEEIHLQKMLPDHIDLEVILEALAELYHSRGIQLCHMGDSWAFRTAPDVADYLQDYAHNSRRLSQAACETLAIIAYYQPVTRAEIENIRGVSLSKGSLDVLIQNGWVKPGKRKELPGRPLTWCTTDNFLDHFGLENLQQLPDARELQEMGVLERSLPLHVLSDREEN